ncbi:MAG: hypothetical protein ACOC4J_01465, partial [Bacteroidota bacterium]
MSKSKKNHLTATELIQLLKAQPNEAYSLVESSLVHYLSEESDSFWKKYFQLDINTVAANCSESISVINKFEGIQLFRLIKLYYEKEIKNIEKQINAIEPNGEAILKAVFICIEIGYSSTPSPNFPEFSEESLKASKLVLKKFLPRNGGANNSLSTELVSNCSLLIRLQTDLLKLWDLLYAFLYGGFSLQEKVDRTGYYLVINENEKSNNLFILNELKQKIKRDFKKSASQSDVSQDDHFKKIDPKWRTNEGFATSFISAAKTISQHPGTTSIPVEDGYFDNWDSEDHKKRTEAITRVLQDFNDQHFHHNYRQALSGIYQPNDEVDIKKMHIVIKSNLEISLHDILCANSCLIAMAHKISNLIEDARSDISELYFGSIKHYQMHNPSLPLKEIQEYVDSNFTEELIILNETDKFNPFVTISKSDTLFWLKSIEDLKRKSDIELNAIIDILSGFQSGTPYNLIYGFGKSYLFFYKSCLKFDLNRTLYDHYLSDELFNSRNKIQEKLIIIGKNHREREALFTQSIGDLLNRFTKNVKVALIIKNPKTKKTIGDFDVLAYFEPENTFLSIQVKLSNVTPKTEKRKTEWVSKHIQKALEQTDKDNLVLKNSNSGFELVCKELGIDFISNKPEIFHLIVTDNFFVDHQSYEYQEGKIVTCISYFELKHLLLNEKIHQNQDDWTEITNKNAVSNL